MELIGELSFEKRQGAKEVFNKRVAARGLILNEKGEVALMYGTLRKYYKLPGGGVEGNEEHADAFRRECLEETGCVVEIERELGLVREIRVSEQLVQDSYCYAARVVSHGAQSLTEKEQAQGFVVVWQEPREALRSLSKVRAASLNARYVSERDSLIVRKGMGI